MIIGIVAPGWFGFSYDKDERAPQIIALRVSFEGEEHRR
jgi:hypothetical protein